MSVIEATVEGIAKRRHDQQSLVKVATRSLPQTSVQHKHQKESVACADNAKHCKEWIAESPQLCKNAQKTMERECRKSCSLC